MRLGIDVKDSEEKLEVRISTNEFIDNFIILKKGKTIEEFYKVLIEMVSRPYQNKENYSKQIR